MNVRRFHGVAAMPSASLLLDLLARTLTGIKHAHGLHDRDMGEILGKSRDRVMEAREGNADISRTSWLRGVKQWGGEFANADLAETGYRLAPLSAVITPDEGKLRPLCNFIADVGEIMPDGITNAELVSKAASIEAAGRIIDEFRARLSIARTIRVAA